MNSVYSIPKRNDNMHDYEDIPLRDFNQPQQNQPQQIQPQQIQRIEHEETKKSIEWKWKTATYCLGPSFLVSLIIAAIFIPLFIIEKNKSPGITKTGTVSTIITTTTSIPGKASTSTQTLSAVTHTLPPMTQTTIQTQTEVSHITTEITKTSALTITDTTSITVTPTKDPHDGKRCNNKQLYGGQELHDINSDYDLLLVDAVQEAVDNGMDIGDAQVLEVAEKSVFLCSGSHSIELVEACESGFEHNGDNVSCNSGGSYPIPSPTQTATETMTASMSTRRRIIRASGS